MGNTAVGRLFRSRAGGGRSADAAERQAERVAEAAVRGGEPAAGEIAVERPPPADPAAARDLLARLGAGRALDDGTRAAFEARLGRDLSRVRLHTGERAAELARDHGARAFTVGRHVVLGAGERAAGTGEGTRLLAHELTHVAQQESAGEAAVQRHPAPPPPPNYNQLVGQLATFVRTANNPADPPAVRTALAHLATFGVALNTVTFSRLTNVTWVMGGGLHRHAESRWPAGGNPEIAVSDALLGEFHRYRTNRTANADDAFSVIRTIAHELRHLQRAQQRSTGARTATVTEQRFEAEVARRAAATPAGLTPQQYANVYSGRVLYARTAYPVEEILSKLAEVRIAQIEWNRLSSQPGGAGSFDRQRMERILHRIGFRIYYQVNILRGSARQGTAGLTAADVTSSLTEITNEVNTRYGTSSPERRMWDLARSGQISTALPAQPARIVTRRVGTGTRTVRTYTYQPAMRIFVLPRVFP